MEVKKIWRGCPKCNAPPKDVGMFLDEGAFYVKCCKCGTCTNMDISPGKVIEDWNNGKV